VIEWPKRCSIGPPAAGSRLEITALGIRCHDAFAFEGQCLRGYSLDSQRPKDEALHAHVVCAELAAAPKRSLLIEDATTEYWQAGKPAARKLAAELD
jgi:hypothetical protein